MEALKRLEGLVDIWLPDFKTMSPELSVRYMKAPDHPERAMEALEWMISVSSEEFADFPSVQGSPVYDEETLLESGLMKSGVCVRHLVIPGQYEDSLRVLEYLSQFKDKIWISVMSQYTPMRKDFPYPELKCRVDMDEYEKIVDRAGELGLERCMIQLEGAAGESFIPVFDGEGVIYLK